jgi:exonuclease III
MAKFLRIAQWNANGLLNHREKIKIFLDINATDILLINETHFTNKIYLSIPKYNLYHTNHPDDKAHGGAAILIKKKNSTPRIVKIRTI